MGVQSGEVHAGSNKLHGKLSNIKFKLFHHKKKVEKHITGINRLQYTRIT